MFFSLILENANGDRVDFLIRIRLKLRHCLAVIAHARIAGCADRAGGRIQSFHPRCHILICGGGHVRALFSLIQRYAEDTIFLALLLR